MCMARVNVYLPDDLASAARAAGLNVSAVAQAALTRALAQAATDTWLEGLAAQPSSVKHADALEALDAGREDLGG